MAAGVMVKEEPLVTTRRQYTAATSHVNRNTHGVHYERKTASAFCYLGISNAHATAIHGEGESILLEQ